MLRDKCSKAPKPTTAKTRPRTSFAGGPDIVDSIICKKSVPARGVKFKAEKQGLDKIIVCNKPIMIHVKSQLGIFIMVKLYNYVILYQPVMLTI